MHSQNICKIDCFGFGKIDFMLIGVESASSSNFGEGSLDHSARQEEREGVEYATAFRKPGILVPYGKKW